MSGTISPYQWSPDLLEEVISTVPRLVKGKPALLSFFRGAAVPEQTIRPIETRYLADQNGTKKAEIARAVLTALNALGDGADALRARREVLKRITEYEDFSVCWPNDQREAELGVRRIRDLIGRKDSFTAMRMEKDREALERRAKVRAEQDALHTKNQRLDGAKIAFASLFGMSDPQARGRAFESALTTLFKAHDVLIREPFVVRADNGVATEQIDGAVDFSHRIWLVEAKWHEGGIDVPAISQHCYRLFKRQGVGGIFISGNSYKQSALNEVQNAIAQVPVILLTLNELWKIVDQKSDLRPLLDDRANHALLHKRPYVGCPIEAD
jgi:restriction system protein